MEKRFEIHHKKFDITNESQRKFEITNLESDASTPISLIEPIEGGGVLVETREDLIKVVEPPLLEACQQLFDKNIKTVFSSANKKDVTIGHAHIAIDYDSLSEKNKEIATTIGTIGNIHGSRPRVGIYLEIPIDENSTLGDIESQSLALTQRFENQT